MGIFRSGIIRSANTNYYNIFHAIIIQRPLSVYYMKAAIPKDFDSRNSGYDVYILFTELCGNGMRICSRNHPSFSSIYMEPS